MIRQNVKTIFIVDDNELQAELLKDYLVAHTPHEISIFKTGEECLQRLSEEPNIVILDYILNSVNPKAANGMKILEAIRNSNWRIHVIMLSCQEDYATAIKTITKGALEYVMKGDDAFEKILKIIID